MVGPRVRVGEGETSEERRTWRRKCVASASSPSLKRHSELKGTADARRSTSTG